MHFVTQTITAMLTLFNINATDVPEDQKMQTLTDEVQHIAICQADSVTMARLSLITSVMLSITADGESKSAIVQYYFKHATRSAERVIVLENHMKKIDAQMTELGLDGAALSATKDKMMRAFAEKLWSALNGLMVSPKGLPDFMSQIIELDNQCDAWVRQPQFENSPSDEKDAPDNTEPN